MKNRLTALVICLWVAFILWGLSCVTQARTVADLGDIRFTDQRGHCPRLYRVARRADLSTGCWTIHEHTRAITIRWDDGSTQQFTEIQFEIYGRVN